MVDHASTQGAAGSQRAAVRDVAMRSVVAAGLIDAAFIIVFAAIGRASHSEAQPVLESLSVAWPFLVGAAAGWAIAWYLLGRAPTSLVAALPIWLAAIVLGMSLRAATGRGIAVSFIIVATLFLGLFLLGWRVILLLWRRRRTQ